MDGVNFNKQQANLLPLMEKILDKMLHVTELMGRWHEDHKVLQHQIRESFLVWEDQATEEGEEDAVEGEEIVTVPTEVTSTEITPSILINPNPKLISKLSIPLQFSFPSFHRTNDFFRPSLRVVSRIVYPQLQNHLERCENAVINGHTSPATNLFKKMHRRDLYLGMGNSRRNEKCTPAFGLMKSDKKTRMAKSVENFKSKKFFAPYMFDILPLEGVFGWYGMKLLQLCKLIEKQILWPFDRGKEEEIISPHKQFFFPSPITWDEYILSVISVLFLKLEEKSFVSMKNTVLKISDRVLHRGGFSYCGQRCTTVMVILMMESVADTLVEKVKARVSKLTVGPPEEDCDITPVLQRSKVCMVVHILNSTCSKKCVGSFFCAERGTLKGSMKIGVLFILRKMSKLKEECVGEKLMERHILEIWVEYEDESEDQTSLVTKAEIIEEFGDTLSGNGFLLLDSEFNVKGRWENLISSSWAIPAAFPKGFNLQHVFDGLSGRHLHEGSWAGGELRPILDLGNTELLPLEIKFLHDPTKDTRFVGYALTNNMVRILKTQDGPWNHEVAISVKPLKVQNWILPKMPGLIIDFFYLS